MAVLQPPVLVPPPARPDRANRDTFAARADAWTVWERDHQLPELTALGENVFANATTTAAAVDTALAAGLANAAANATQTAVDRVQTGADRVATGADRVQTGLDRAAVGASLASVAGGPVVSVNGKTGVATLIATDIAPAATGVEMAAGTETGHRSMSPSLVAAAVAAKSAATGDLLVTARNPGVGWLAAGAVYLKSAHTNLYTQLGLIKDTPIGTAWTVYGSVNLAGQAINSFTKVDATTFVFCTSGGRIFRSTNRGVSFTLVYTDPTMIVNAISSAEGTATLFAACGSGRVAKSTDGGATWANSYSNDGYPFHWIIAFSTSIVVTFDGNNYIWRSTDGGLTFVRGQNIISLGPGYRHSDTVGYVSGGSNSQLHTTENAGQTWFATSTANYVYAITRVANVVYIGTSGGLMKSEVMSGNIPGGFSFVRDSNNAVVAASPAPQSFVKIGSTWILGSDFRYWRSTDDLTSAELIELPPNVRVGNMLWPIKMSETEVIFGMSGIVIRSSDYSYDEATQFVTPKIIGIGTGAGAYIKE